MGNTYVGNSPAIPVGVIAGNSLPATGNVGEFYYHMINNILYMHDGTTWQDLIGSGNGVSVGTNLPASGSAGDLFFQTSDNKLYNWDTTGWIPVIGTEFGAAFPGSGEIGDLFFRTDTATLYIYNGSNWNPVGSSSIVDSGTTTPASGSSSGQLFFNTTSNDLLVWSGSAWVTITSVSNPTMPSGATLPGTAANGELFYNTTDHLAYFRQNGAWTRIVPGYIKNGSVLPTGVSAGQLFYSTESGNEGLRIYDGTDWTELAGGGTSVTIGSPLPGTASVGDLFFESSEETMYVYDGATWTEIGDSGVGVGATLPASGSAEVGDLFFETSSEKIYVQLGGSWQSLMDIVVDYGNAFPSGPQTGQLFYNSDESVMYAYTGSTWIPIGQTSFDSPASGNAIGYNPTTSVSTALTTPSNAGAKYAIKSIHVTNITSSPQYIDVWIKLESGANISVAYHIPIPENASLELLKKIKVIGANEQITMRASSNGTLNTIISYNTLYNPNIFGSGSATIGTSLGTVYSASTKSRLDSVLVTNRDTADHIINVVWTNASNAIQGYLCYNMVIPENATVELCTNAFYLPSGHRIRAETDMANVTDVYISGEKA